MCVTRYAHFDRLGGVGGKNGDVGKALLKGNQKMVDSFISFYKTHFPDSYYLELVRTGRADEEAYEVRGRYPPNTEGAVAAEAGRAEGNGG